MILSGISLRYPDERYKDSQIAPGIPCGTGVWGWRILVDLNVSTNPHKRRFEHLEKWVFGLLVITLLMTGLKISSPHTNL